MFYIYFIQDIQDDDDVNDINRENPVRLKDVYEPDITTYGEFLNTIKEDLRERMIDRLVALQTNEISIKKYKIIDEDLYSKVEAKLEDEKEQKKVKNKKNREVR